MDKPQEEQGPAPIYRCKATVWIEKTYTVLAGDDDAVEDAVCESLQDDGLDLEEFRLVRLEWTCTPEHWH